MSAQPLTLNATEQQACAWIDQQQALMEAKLWQLANINSGSYNLDGIAKVAATLATWAQDLNCDLQYIDLAQQDVVDNKGQIGQQQLGQALQLRQRPEAPLQLFLCAHMDTVFAVDHHFQEVRWLDEEHITGPGVADLKGGIVVMLTALQALEASPLATSVGWTVLFNPDEEIGSPGSASLFPAFADSHHVGLIYEPSFADGNLAGERKGSGNFSVVSHGKAAHAGREHHLGRNAIRAMADFVSAIDELNGKRQGVTINPGFIEGGGATNVVPDTCVMKFNIRTQQPSDEAWCQAQLQSILADINLRDGINLDLHGHFGRTPKVMTPAWQQLCDLLQSCSQSLQMPTQFMPTGGCCDGNNLAASGLPNIDTLGVQGGNIHSDKEYMRLASLSERAKLSALLMLRLAKAGPDIWS
ncbi:MAG TPA: hypothetical protein DE179_04745 [Oceanospirillaceae bacterium]|nr:hypothetical protein [Oceanospirillaceae bacterium]